MRLIDASVLPYTSVDMTDLPLDSGLFVVMAEDIENAPTIEPEQRWIPVSKETNPKKSGWYLVTVDEEMTADDKRYSGIAEYNATTGEWYDMDDPTDLYLAWQNMPEPWKGG